MSTVNMHTAKTKLSQLVEAAERGESVIIARNGKPAAQLIAMKQIGVKQNSQRSWSNSVKDWLKEGKALELELSKDDLAPLKERDLF